MKPATLSSMGKMARNIRVNAAETKTATEIKLTGPGMMVFETVYTIEPINT